MCAHLQIPETLPTAESEKAAVVNSDSEESRRTSEERSIEQGVGLPKDAEREDSKEVQVQVSSHAVMQLIASGKLFAGKLIIGCSSLPLTPFCHLPEPLLLPESHYTRNEKKAGIYCLTQLLQLSQLLLPLSLMLVHDSLASLQADHSSVTASNGGQCMQRWGDVCNSHSE